jgi:hypothetical protein
MGYGLSTCVPVLVIACLKQFLILFLIVVANIATIADNPKMFVALIPVDLLLFPFYLFLLFWFICAPIIRDIDREYYYRFQYP